MPNQAESASLRNYSMSIGWRKEEVALLRTALMKFGIGRWTKIRKLNLLPYKSQSQIHLQTQRLVG